MVKRSFASRGITLTELLIVVALIGVVFAGAISMYTSGLKFLGTRQSIDVSTTPDIALEQITRKITVANSVGAGLSQAGNTQLNIRSDWDCAGNALNTPSNVNDDKWWHFRLMNPGTQILAYCDNTQNPALTAVGTPPGTVVLMGNLDTAASNFQITSPSNVGSPTVVSLHIVCTNPVMTVDTEAALGASTKR